MGGYETLAGMPLHKPVESVYSRMSWNRFKDSPLMRPIIETVDVLCERQRDSIGPKATLRKRAQLMEIFKLSPYQEDFTDELTNTHRNFQQAAFGNTAKLMTLLCTGIPMMSTPQLCDTDAVLVGETTSRGAAERMSRQVKTLAHQLGKERSELSEEDVLGAYFNGTFLLLPQEQQLH